MTPRQGWAFVGFVLWAHVLICDASGKTNGLQFGPDARKYDIGPQHRMVSKCKQWQFCDEWRVVGPDGRMIERRVI